MTAAKGRQIWLKSIHEREAAEILKDALVLPTEPAQRSLDHCSTASTPM